MQNYCDKTPVRPPTQISFHIFAQTRINVGSVMTESDEDVSIDTLVFHVLPPEITITYMLFDIIN